MDHELASYQESIKCMAFHLFFMQHQEPKDCMPTNSTMTIENMNKPNSGQKRMLKGQSNRYWRRRQKRKKRKIERNFKKKVTYLATLVLLKDSSITQSQITVPSTLSLTRLPKILEYRKKENIPNFKSQSANSRHKCL